MGENKSKIQLFISTTLDGFIARENGSLDWLLALHNPNQIDHGYNSFINEVDVIIMGRKTYEVLLGLVTEWPYPNFKTYVVSRDEKFSAKTVNTFILNELNEKIISEIQLESLKNIWLVGGGNLITQFLNTHAIDEITLSIIPIVLGKGIRLFPDEPKETHFELVKSEPFETGVVNLVYKRK